MHDSAMWRGTVYLPVHAVFIRRMLWGFSIKRNKNKFAGGIQKRSGACYGESILLTDAHVPKICIYESFFAEPLSHVLELFNERGHGVKVKKVI